MTALNRAVLLVALVPALAFAGELKGVKMPDSVQVGDKTLALNGMGLRTKIVFKVYVAGLYLEGKSKDAKAILEKDEARRIHLKMMRDLDKKAMGDAIKAGFEQNNKANMPALKERLDKLMAELVDLKENDDVVITYLPGKGTTLAVKGKDSTSIDGKDFADAMLSVWLGQNPVQDDLKDGLLGK